MDETNISFDIDDLPEDITVKELKDYLRSKYQFKYITIVSNPFKIFGFLPPELIAEILRSEQHTRQASKLINKSITENVMPKFYEDECMSYITEKELLNEIQNNADEPQGTVSAVIVDYTDNGIFMYQYLKFTDEGKIETNNTARFFKKENGNIIIESYHDIFVSIEDINTNVDPFCENIILSFERPSCKTYNPKYADKILVDRYNEEIAIELNIINEDAIYTIFKVIYIAHSYKIVQSFLIDVEFELINDGEYDIQSDILDLFNKSRDGIKDQVIQLTGANISEYNEHILIL